MIAKVKIEFTISEDKIEEIIKSEYSKLYIEVFYSELYKKIEQDIEGCTKYADNIYTNIIVENGREYRDDKKEN